MIYFGNVAQMADHLIKVERFSRISVTSQDNVLMFFVVKHVLPCYIHYGENVRLLIRARLQNVSFVMLMLNNK